MLIISSSSSPSLNGSSCSTDRAETHGTGTNPEPVQLTPPTESATSSSHTNTHTQKESHHKRPRSIHSELAQILWGVPNPSRSIAALSLSISRYPVACHSLPKHHQGEVPLQHTTVTTIDGLLRRTSCSCALECLECACGSTFFRNTVLEGTGQVRHNISTFPEWAGPSIDECGFWDRQTVRLLRVPLIDEWSHWLGRRRRRRCERSSHRLSCVWAFNSIPILPSFQPRCRRVEQSQKSNLFSAAVSAEKVKVVVLAYLDLSGYSLFLFPIQSFYSKLTHNSNNNSWDMRFNEMCVVCVFVRCRVIGVCVWWSLYWCGFVFRLGVFLLLLVSLRFSRSKMRKKDCWVRTEMVNDFPM